MEIEILGGIIGVMFQVNRLVTIYSGAAILRSIDTTTKRSQQPVYDSIW